MHEIGLMQEALDIALQHAARQGARRIDHLTMRVGDASGVDAESVSLAFEVTTRGTIAEGAQLDVRQCARFEGQAAMELEFAIGEAATDATYPFRIGDDVPTTIRGLGADDPRAAR
jgi:Zn finger protein HypA/HybF involved in hydrogenase expression